MTFETPQYELRELLKKIHDGRWQLPDFQRSYKWDEERIRSLLLTILRGYPLGSIMALDTSNKDVRFKPRPFEGTTQAIESPEMLILDGQQRLTSLYRSLWGDGVVDTESHRRQKVRRRYFLDLNKAFSDEEIPDEAVFNTPEDGVIRSNFNRDIELDLSTPEHQARQLMLPVSTIFSFSEHFSHFSGLPEGMTTRLMNLSLQLNSYKIPAIKLGRDTPKGAVATVFEKVNTGGLQLNVFELLTATFAGDADYYATHGNDFRLTDDWRKTQEIIDKWPMLGNFGRSDFLQAVTLLASYPKATRTTARREDMLRLSLSDYLPAAEQIRESLHWVALFLKRERIHTAQDVPYPTQIIPLAVVRSVVGDKLEAHGAISRLRRWFWCGVMGELYGSTTETRFVSDVESLPAWVLAGDVSSVPPPRTINEASFVESRLLSLRTRNSAAYKGIYALLIANDSEDWIHARNFNDADFAEMAVDIHHIFPRSWCDRNAIPADLRDSIVNKTPLRKQTNIRIGGAAPSVYLPRVARYAEIDDSKLDSILRSHMINPEHLRKDDFRRFFIDRRHRLIELIEQAMGKSVQRDINDDQLLGGTEQPSAFAPDPEDR